MKTRHAKQNGGFDPIDDNAGPGQSSSQGRPVVRENELLVDPFGGIGRSCGLTREKLRPLVDPPDRDKGGIKLKEKRLDARLWRYNGGPSEM